MNEKCDFLVIGSGIAGLCFAIHASQYGTVKVITKKSSSESNTNHAQGGIACVLDNHDSFESHVRDTLVAGCGLCDEKAVRLIVENGPERIQELIKWGVHFSHSSRKTNPLGLHLGKEGGHSVNRIVHAHDLTGKEVEQTLLHQLRRNRSVHLLENHVAIDLITNHHVGSLQHGNRCYGAYVFNTKSRIVSAIQSKITCIAAGGVGQVYLHTTNPDIATGDGMAMAYRAGAEIANMEFLQFHPTTLYHPDGNSYLISEALRGFGAILKDSHGNEFMKKYHPLHSLAPRDIVARAIDTEIKKSGDPCVFLDIRHIAATKVKNHFPNIFARCKELGIDITKNLIPVVPAAHYMCGGIKVDLAGNSSLPNLYACGESACTGVHGANRLASNSLLEALVFSKRSVSDSCSKILAINYVADKKIPSWDDSGTMAAEEWVLLSHNFREIRTAMWDYVGIVRSDFRLHRALRRITMLEGEIEDFYRCTKIIPPLLELRNMVATAKMIVISALRRKESRGLHFTTDYPETDNRHWKKDTILSKRI